jgi:tRNA(adenine34) deaminase
MDSYFMSLALEQARIAADMGEVPVGAVIVKDGKVIAAAHNERERTHNPVLHAECSAIMKAGQALGTWNLSGCTLYVTLEPCPMCAGAIIQSHLSRLVLGAEDEKGGACGGVCNLFAMPFNHAPVVTRGVLADESVALLKKFFKDKR